MKLPSMIVLGLIATIWDSIFYGITGSILWEWFVANQFNTISLSISHALGIALLVKTFSKSWEYMKQDEEKNKLPIKEMILRGFGYPPLFAFFTLSFGYILALFL